MNKKPIVIGITGKARSGKDTFADFLVEHHGFKKYAIADGLKEAALAVNPIVQWDPYSEKPVRLKHVVHPWVTWRKIILLRVQVGYIPHG